MVVLSLYLQGSFLLPHTTLWQFRAPCPSKFQFFISQVSCQFIIQDKPKTDSSLPLPTSSVEQPWQKIKGNSSTQLLLSTPTFDTVLKIFYPIAGTFGIYGLGIPPHYPLLPPSQLLSYKSTEGPYHLLAHLIT